MAETPTEIKVPVTLPVYTRVNGQEIELGTYSLTVPIKVEITGSGEALSDEGPWLRWQDVPEGVLYTDRRRNGRWCNGRGERFVAGASGCSEIKSIFSESAMRYFAPFVRV